MFGLILPNMRNILLGKCVVGCYFSGRQAGLWANSKGGIWLGKFKLPVVIDHSLFCVPEESKLRYITHYNSLELKYLPDYIGQQIFLTKKGLLVAKQVISILHSLTAFSTSESVCEPSGKRLQDPLLCGLP